MAYLVSLENRATWPVTARFSLEAEGLEIALRPPELTLAAGQHRRLRVVAESRGSAGRRDATFTVTAEGVDGQTVVRTSRAFLDVPESP
jgi:P pilus assembly chaperone PapD